MKTYCCGWAGCGRPLRDVRLGPLGCMGVLRPVGYCPMHRTVFVPMDDADLEQARADYLAARGSAR